MGVKQHIFIDTNILLRYIVIEAPEHVTIKRGVDSLINTGYHLWINRQVIREFSNVLTRPQLFPTPLDARVVAQKVRDFRKLFEVCDETEQVTEQLLTLMDTYLLGGKQIHDANIVATMLVYQIPQILTLNVADFQRFSKIITLVTLPEILN
jgi:predicted nucleic acid-binding protein